MRSHGYQWRNRMHCKFCKINITMEQTQPVCPDTKSGNHFFVWL